MGNKIEAKQIASKNGLPIIPGSEGGITTLDQAKKICSSIKFPVLIKASGGGGGKVQIQQSKGKIITVLQ